MLPEDTKSRKAQVHEMLQQTQVNDHFEKIQPEDKPEPYSDDLFKEAAIQWLLETDQVCIALTFLAIFDLTQSISSQFKRSNTRPSKG
jgi:hypothetical protein